MLVWKIMLYLINRCDRLYSVVVSLLIVSRDDVACIAAILCSTLLLDIVPACSFLLGLQFSLAMLPGEIDMDSGGTGEKKI